MARRQRSLYPSQRPLPAAVLSLGDHRGDRVAPTRGPQSEVVVVSSLALSGPTISRLHGCGRSHCQPNIVRITLSELRPRWRCAETALPTILLYARQSAVRCLNLSPYPPTVRRRRQLAPYSRQSAIHRNFRVAPAYPARCDVAARFGRSLAQRHRAPSCRLG